MGLTLQQSDVPLREDAHGVVKVTGTRVPLVTIVTAFAAGDAPEQIVRSFPTLKLADVYAVIAYYLKNRQEVDAYVREQEALRQAFRRELEARGGRIDVDELRRRLQPTTASTHG